jgi:hypothetical protein
VNSKAEVKAGQVSVFLQIRHMSHCTLYFLQIIHTSVFLQKPKIAFVKSKSKRRLIGNTNLKLDVLEGGEHFDNYITGCDNVSSCRPTWLLTVQRNLMFLTGYR